MSGSRRDCLEVNERQRRVRELVTCLVSLKQKWGWGGCGLIDQELC